MTRPKVGKRYRTRDGSEKWDLHFEAAIGDRVKTRFSGVKAYPLWWSVAGRKWGDPTMDDFDRSEGCSNTAPVRSVKAFRRHLRRHPELKAAEEIVLVSRWVGYNVTATPSTS